MTPNTLLFFGLYLLIFLTLVSLLLSSAALLQTKALWSALKKHEFECRATDEELFRELRKQFACCSKVQSDILAGVMRLEGIEEGRKPVAHPGGVHKHG
jgi:hypothetical protein